MRKGVSEAVGALVVLLATLAVAVPLAALMWQQAQSGADREQQHIDIVRVYCIMPGEQLRLGIPNATWVCWVRPATTLPAGTTVTLHTASGAVATVKASTDITVNNTLAVPAPQFPKNDLVAYALVTLPDGSQYLAANITYVKAQS